MQVAHLIDGDVERGALQLACRESDHRQVDDHLAVRGHRSDGEHRLVGRVLQWRREGDQARRVGGQHHGSGLRSHVLQRNHLRRDAVLLARLLEGIVGHQSARIDVGGVYRVVHVAEQAALAERGVPDAYLVDEGQHLVVPAHDEACALHGRHVGLGDDRRALSVEVERGGLSAHHVQRVVVVAAQVGEGLMAGHHLRLPAVVQHQVLQAVEAQVQVRHLVQVRHRAVRVGRGGFEHRLALRVAALVVPHLYGVALAIAGAHLRDVGHDALRLVDHQPVVLVLQLPHILHHEVVRVAQVAGHGAVALVHGPEVCQSIDVAVLGIVLLLVGFRQVAAVVVQSQRVDVGLHGAEVQAVVREVVYGLHVLHRHRSVVEQVDVLLVLQGQHVELLLVGVVVQGEERPLVLWHRGLAPVGVLRHRHRDVSVVTDAQGEVVGLLA